MVTEKNIETWWKNNRAALFLADAAKYMITSKMSEKHTAFLETLLNGFADGIEEQGPSFAMRWIFKSAKECADEEGVVTGCAEVNAWIDGYMMEYVGRWLSNNRGCFALLQALEASGSQPLMKSIKKTAKKNPGSCAKVCSENSCMCLGIVIFFLSFFLGKYKLFHLLLYVRHFSERTFMSTKGYEALFAKINEDMEE